MSAPDWDDLVEGASAESREYGPLDQPSFVRYAGASGDFNPIHYHEAFAQAAGFPTVFSQGMLQAGILASFVTDWLGAENVRRYQVQFREQVWPGDVLRCTATVTRRYEHEDGRRIDLELMCTRTDSGGVAIKGEATFVVP